MEGPAFEMFPPQFAEEKVFVAKAFDEQAEEGDSNPTGAEAE